MLSMKGLVNAETEVGNTSFVFFFFISVVSFFHKLALRLTCLVKFLVSAHV